MWNGAKWIMLAATAAVLANAAAGWAQSCSLCYTTAAAAKAAARQALRSGILVLLIPTALIFVAIFAAAFHRGKRLDDDERHEQELERRGNPASTRRQGAPAISSTPAGAPSELDLD